MKLSSSDSFGFVNYENFIDLVNKRVGVISYLNYSYHSKLEEGILYSLKQEVVKLVTQFEAMAIEDDDVIALVNEFKLSMYKPLDILDTNKRIRRSRIHGNLKFNNIKHDKIGNIISPNEATPGVCYDFVFDYAMLRATSSNQIKYTMMLANETFIDIIKNKYKDYNAGTRYIMYIAIIDFIEFMKLYIDIAKGVEVKEVLVEPQIIYKRLYDFMIKSHTTIDYFLHLYA
jgi:hypothetical protein